MISRMSIWRGKDPLILASQSRARQALLANAGIALETMPAGFLRRDRQGFFPRQKFCDLAGRRQT